MAASSVNKSGMHNIPRLHSDSSQAMVGKLLRRPRASKRPQASPERTEAKSVDGYQLDTLRPMTNLSVAETTGRCSPGQSGVHSLVSPPPPSEATHKKRSICYEYQDFSRSMQSRGVAFITKDDKKYVLDPVYREKTLTAGSLSQRGPQTAGSRVGPVSRCIPRGPAPLIPREPRRRPEIVRDFADLTDDARYIRPPEFTLESFLIDLPEIQTIPLMKVKKAMYSRHHYKKIVDLLSKEIQPKCQQMSKVDIKAEDLDIPLQEPRIPQRQLLLELASVIRQHVRETMNAEVKSVIRPLPKYACGFRHGSAPHTEIVLYEEEKQDQFSEELSNEVPNHDAVFSFPRSSFFQGSARSRSPFQGDAVISPAEVAILDSLVSGGTALSLKAHFVGLLPDVSPLVNTLTYLNLSFNDFTNLPEEVLDMSQLEVLKFRNNPISLLPRGIEKLSNLHVLVMNFCQLESLPNELCTLKKLEHLNIAFNKLTSLPCGMGNLSQLREIVMEGNQVPALPWSILKLRRLRAVNVRNNFMHPLFWKDYTKDFPQRLVDLAALAVHKHDLHKNTDHCPDRVKAILSRPGICDCCSGALFGPGMRIIRPLNQFCGIKLLPFMFMACTPQCKAEFKNLTSTLTEMLYGVDAKKAES
ncbi:leucine-rich repeat-containing protein 63-like [Liolophura sinensis]|uniref:leucine-rich repeat-containing protein 63-like n=1 Tax=Liolophura sinensis TaxID=3198878 RepID=UPI0031592AFD